MKYYYENNKTWRDNNYFSRFVEAEESAQYIDDLKKLINGEAVAAIQYKFAAESLVGKNLDYLQGHFSEHSEEEWGHYSQLVAALMQRFEEAEKNLIITINDAMPATNEITSFDAEYLREFFINAETEAIEAYQNFYNSIENVDKDLADIINAIISGEREHKLDFTRMVNEE